MDLEQEYRYTLNSIHQTQETLHILKAEWSYLNDPQRLQRLCEKYLKFKPIRPDQIVSLPRQDISSAPKESSEKENTEKATAQKSHAPGASKLAIHKGELEKFLEGVVEDE